MLFSSLFRQTNVNIGYNLWVRMSFTQIGRLDNDWNLGWPGAGLLIVHQKWFGHVRLLLWISSSLVSPSSAGGYTCFIFCRVSSDGHGLEYRYLKLTRRMVNYHPSSGHVELLLLGAFLLGIQLLCWECRFHFFRWTWTGMLVLQVDQARGNLSSVIGSRRTFAVGCAQELIFTLVSVMPTM